ncbi:MAG: hypothetical protein IT372_15500 [Polyangiaceae bacterium]|nr:hypothetical protein [Polyangiaceae bacterium]
MSSNDLARLEADVAAAEAEVARLREENARLSEAFRAEPTDDGRELLRRGAASLSAARDRVHAAKAALEVLRRSGSLHGLLAEEGRVVGTIAVAVPAGASSAERARLIEEALAGPLAEAARELGVVASAAAERYARERPGRDDEGRTVLDVAGRVEGDMLVPAASAGKLRRG